MNADTPRTNAFVKNLKHHQVASKLANMSFLARQLERDLNKARAYIDFISKYVTQINSLEYVPRGRSSAKGHTLEVVCRHNEEMIVVTADGKTMPEAFYKCLCSAIRRAPKELKVKL